MKIIGIIKNLFRNLKYRRDKKDEEDLTELVDSSDGNDLPTKEENLMIIYRLIRRISLSFILRFIILVPLSIYLLIILTPIGNIKSFIPNAIEKSENFLIVVAHPDDECLFFSPTILGLLSRRKKGHILVFSTGNSNGLGPIRQNELKGSCERLGVDKSRCLSLNLTDLQDDPHRWWAKENISKIVEKYVNEFHIDLLITFDRGGISGHLNHKSLAIGIEYFMKSTNKPLLTYQISTVSFLFQFTSIFNIFPTIIQFLPRLFRNLFSTILPFLFSPPNSKRVLFVNSPLGYFKGLQAFHSHRSQMLWYRHFYTTFSRHMFINDLKQISSN